MATSKPVEVKSVPGVRRDGTEFDGKEYSLAQWCRFYRGRPKKMAGYQAVTLIPEACRGMNSYSQQGTIYLHLGGNSHLTQVQTNFTGNLTSGPTDRTPAGFTASINNLWQQDIMYTTTGAVNNLVAHAGQNLADITNAVETPIYFGPVTATSALVATGMLNVSGGICSVYPYLFGYSNFGRIDVSGINNLSGAPNSAFVTGQKIVKGLPLRNAGGPAALFWSLDSLIMATFNPAILTGIPFNFNTVTDDTSILSSQGVVEYDGIYFWMGVDRFLMFNGVVREVPNQMNLSYFFDNLNFTQRQKAFAIKVPRWGEIWFCFPFGNSTECNQAVIYNVREGTWYDTALPASLRTAGEFARVYQRPFMCDNGSAGSNFTLWQHEVGTDAINGTNVQPIDSFFVTDEKDFLDQGIDKCMRVDILEPDLVQTGNLTVTVIGRANARSQDIESQSVTFVQPSFAPNPPLDQDEQVVRFKESRRLLRFRFESNTAGGDYYIGKTLEHIEPSEGRITQ